MLLEFVLIAHEFVGVGLLIKWYKYWELTRWSHSGRSSPFTHPFIPHSDLCWLLVLSFSAAFSLLLLNSGHALMVPLRPCEVSDLVTHGGGSGIRNEIAASSASAQKASEEHGWHYYIDPNDDNSILRMPTPSTGQRPAGKQAGEYINMAHERSLY